MRLCGDSNREIISSNSESRAPIDRRATIRRRETKTTKSSSLRHIFARYFSPNQAAAYYNLAQMIVSNIADEERSVNRCPELDTYAYLPEMCR